MKSFSTVFQEMKQTKRVGIQHLNQLKPLDFIKLVKLVKEEMGGKISKTNSSVSLKVDGFGLRFGLNNKDEFFIESSNSGPQFKVDAFSEYTKNKKGEVDKISIAYDQVFKSLKSNKKLQKILKENNTDSGIKIICECLYTPIGKKDKDKIKFVSINYDQKKLGEIATFVLIKVIDGDNNILDQNILEYVKELSSKQFLFTDATVTLDDIDLTIEIDNVLKFVKKYPDLDKIVLSRKKVDKEIKNLIKDTLKNYQEQMSDKLLKSIKSTKFGDEFEGIVFNLLKGKSFKVISKSFSQGIKFKP